MGFLAGGQRTTATNIANQYIQLAKRCQHLLNYSEGLVRFADITTNGDRFAPSLRCDDARQIIGLATIEGNLGTFKKECLCNGLTYPPR